MSSKNATSDALEIMRRRYFDKPDPERDARMAAYGVALSVAQAVYDLREATGLDQGAFAERVGLMVTDIRDLEDADFCGDPVSTLNRIAEALNHEVRVTVVPKQAA